MLTYPGRHVFARPDALRLASVVSPPRRHGRRRRPHGRRSSPGWRSRSPPSPASARAPSPTAWTSCPTELTAEPLAQRTRVLAADGSRARHALRPEPRQRPARQGLADHAQGDRRDRGLPLLPARRPRPEGHAARLHHQPGQLRRRPGRLVDHPADGQADAGQPGEDARPSSRRPGRHLRSASSTSCATRSPSRRSTARTGSSSATSTSPTSATAPTASRPPPGTTSPSPPRKLKLREAALLAGIVKNPTQLRPDQRPEPGQASGATSSSPGWPSSTSSPQRGAQGQAKRASGSTSQPTRNGCVGVDGEFFCDYVREYLLAGPGARPTVDGPRAAARRRRPHHPDHDRPAHAAGGRPRRRTPASAHRPGDRRAGDGRARAPARCGRSPSRARWARDKAKGETYLNYVVPKEYGDANGFQAGSTFKAFVLAAAIKQGIPLSTRINVARSTVDIPPSQLQDLRRHPGEHRHLVTVRTPPATGTYDLYTGTQQSVNTFFAQLEAAHRALRPGHARPRHGRRRRRNGRRSARSRSA